ncbi:MULTISPECIES: YetF domain-containing protein [Tepidibacillus]|uniref:YetF C-terminal domain-containing protein n=1 Tax=Tepidibacillus decaturensis TaxID=1413211 RepID=A0A135L185_9BACI|nr:MULTISPECIES: DUF421 domain-containing protein [Tepidibacillus]KXG42771.1 hypothetical protein U473_00950 [Tepidibacillus decaturensis]GBF12362.1 hypothetical protein HK1_02423 [Tepidibacillus sp. HK-1]
MDESIVTIVRSVIAFTTLLIFTRLLGKQQVGQLTAFEYVAGITIGSAASSLSIDLSIKPLPQWLGLATWVVLVWLLQRLAIKHRWMAKVVDDQPTILIQHGKILEQNLKNLRYRYDELLSQLRDRDIFDITQVEFALLEPDGKLTVLKKAEYEPVTRKDLQIIVPPNQLMTEVILDGKIIEQNLQNRKKTREWLQQQLQAQGIDDFSQVSFAVILPNEQLYIDKFPDAIQSMEIGDFKGPY